MGGWQCVTDEYASSRLGYQEVVVLEHLLCEASLVEHAIKYKIFPNPQMLACG